MNWLQLITNSFYESKAVSIGEPVPPELSSLAIDRLNMILDTWSAARRYCYNVNFAVFTLQPNHSPHTIGPTGDFVVANRPTKIEACDLVLVGTNPVVDLLVAVRDDDWWAQQQVKSLTSSVVTDLYYSPDYPNGSLYFWPISTAANQVRLETWVSVSQITNAMLPSGLQSQATSLFSSNPSLRINWCDEYTLYI